jgi:hypothetical protein
LLKSLDILKSYFLAGDSTGVWTQGFTLARQALYHVSHSTSPKSCEYFLHLILKYYLKILFITEFFQILCFWQVPHSPHPDPSPISGISINLDLFRNSYGPPQNH